MTLLLLLKGNAAVVALSGTSAGSSSTTGALSVARGLSGTSAGTSSSSGALRVAWALAGSSAGSSVTSGSLGVALPLSGSSAGSSSTAGALRVAIALSGVSTGGSSTSGFLAVAKAIVSPVFDAGTLVDLVALTSANSEPWAHEETVQRPGLPRRTVTIRPAQVPVASAVAGPDGTVVFAGAPVGRYWIIGEREGVVRRVARQVVASDG